MQKIPNLLTCISPNNTLKDLETNTINTLATNMLKSFKQYIKNTYKSTQKDLDLIYVLDQCTYKLPNQYSIKKQTKWEIFAAKKGIKKRKGKFVYDEELKKYVCRYGSTSKKNMELRGGVSEGKSVSSIKREKNKKK